MTTSTGTNDRSSYVSLLWIMLFDHTSLNIIFPVLTLLFFDSQSRLFPAGTLDAVRSHWYGLCIAIPPAVNFFCAPLLGILSDCYGRKNILLVASLGALIFALTAAFSVLYGSLALLFVACFIRGMFSRTNPVAQAVVGDLNLDGQTAGLKSRKIIYMGYLQTAISLGAFVGPVLGGNLAGLIAFDRLNFSLPFFVAAVFALIAFFLTLCFFRETLKERHSFSLFKITHWPSLRGLVTNRRIAAISLVLLLSQFSWSLYYQFIPPTLKILLHASAHQIGYFVGWIAVWLALSTWLGIRLLDQFLEATGILMVSLWLVFVGTLFSVLFLAYFPSETGQWLLWLTAVPVAAGDVIAFSCLCTLYSDAVQKTEQGRIMGVCFIVIAAVWTTTGLIGGQLLAMHTLLPLVVAPAGALISVIAARWVNSED